MYVHTYSYVYMCACHSSLFFVLILQLAVALEEQRTQNALHLREQREEFRREVELELMIDREKNQLLLLHYQRDGAQLQQRVKSC